MSQLAVIHLGEQRMKRLAVVVLVVGIGLAGGLWVFLQGSGGSKGVAKPVAPCTNGECTVEVSVSHCSITVADSFTVTGENNIFWELDNESKKSYQFRDGDGVILKAASPEFDLPEAQANNKKFKLHDKNSLHAQSTYTYPYTINIQWKFGTWFDCRALDPIIVNQG
jgi:hypothetical protein